MLLLLLEALKMGESVSEPQVCLSAAWYVSMALCANFATFSLQVNASGQFCGVAEMAGSVDFNKSLDVWQQDKWTGRFNVKWHIIKDIPNCQFRHIILANNDNKPVTNSRDTQEVGSK